MPLTFSLATPDDDGALRALVRGASAPGLVELATAREPSFFAADAASGERVQTLIARARLGGPPVAVVQRAVREVYVGGTEARIATLGGLRARSEHGGVPLMGGGWAALRALHDADPTPFTLLSVTSENERARRLFRLRRGAAPRLDAVADLVTLALPVRKRRARLDVVTDAVRAQALRHASPSALRPVRLTLPGSTEALVATRGGRDAGTLTVWDPSSVRQYVVASYGGLLRHLRPFLNATARLGGAVSPLPPAGEALRVAFAAGLVAPDTEALDALLDAALARAHAMGAAFLLVGFDATDPLAAHARRRLHLAYPSTLFAARWTDDAPPFPDLRPVHAEIATY